MENLINRPTAPNIPFTQLEQYQAYGLDRFLQAEWPTCREEPWRRTDISAIDFSGFAPYQNVSQGQVQARDNTAHVAGYAHFNGTGAHDYHLDE